VTAQLSLALPPPPRAPVTLWERMGAWMVGEGEDPRAGVSPCVGCRHDRAGACALLDGRGGAEAHAVGVWVMRGERGACPGRKT
jgi:hypothetical protein